MRAKFILSERTQTIEGYRLIFVPVTAKGSAENEEFFKWTPYGKIEIGTINDAVASSMVVGGEYWVDFTEALANPIKK